MLHVTHKSSYNPDGNPLTIGEDVTVGHKVMLHGCTIGNRVLVGMGSILLDGAIVEDDVMIGVVGPTRMDYAQVTARLSYFAESLSKMFAKPEQPQLPGTSDDQT